MSQLQVNGKADQVDFRGALTDRELQVLGLMAEGMTTKLIASKLDVSFKTAACHRAHVLQKLGVDCTVSAVRWAIKQGLVTL